MLLPRFEPETYCCHSVRPLNVKLLDRLFPNPQKIESLVRSSSMTCSPSLTHSGDL